MADQSVNSAEAPGQFKSRFARLRYTFRVDNHWYLILLAACIGCVTALGAVAFMWFLHFAQDLFLRWPPFSGATDDGIGSHFPLWLLIVGPTVGAAICGTIVVFGAPEAKGHGVPEVMVALYRRKGQIRPRVALFKSLASAFTIGSGGSAGAEGPIVQIGSAIGSNVGRLLGVGTEHTGTLLGCGAAAGIASVFNAPIAGIFFVLEILLRDFSIRTFTPIVIASVFSAAVTQALHGYTGAIFAVSREIGADEFTIFELPYYLCLGLLCGVVAVSFTKALDRTETFYAKLQMTPIVKPVTGAIVFGIMSVIVVLLARHAFGQSTNIPAYYGNGYPFIGALLTGELFTEFDGVGMLALGLIALVVLKTIATCMILGSGGSGGIFAPSLFIGAATGGAFGIMVTQLDPLHLGAVSPASYALVGMAAVVSGTTHAPLTAILIVFEITTDYKVILPIMLAAAVSTLIAQFILDDSIYTIKVRRAGIRVGRLSDLTVLRRISVKSVPLSTPVKAHPNEPASRLLELAEFNNAADFVIVDEHDRYLGMVTSDDLRTTLLQIEALPLLVVDELMRADIPTTSPEETLDIVMDKFTQSDTATLPVLSDDGKGRVLGMISRSRMMREYHLALDHP